MTSGVRALARRVLAATIVVLMAMIASPRIATAVEVGQPAPGFKLPATTGGDISLSDFRGKKFVLLEFYSADFAPT